MSRANQILLLVMVAAFGHAWPLGGEYIYDDYIYVALNPAVQAGLANWTAFFTDPGTYSSTNAPHYRPFVTLSYAVVVALGGGVVGQKLMQLAIHAGTAVSLFWALSVAWRRFGVGHPALPLGAALVFALMPFNVEAVHYLTARSATLCGLFCLISLALYLSFRAETRPGRQALFYGLHLVTLALALLSKETAVTMPAVLLMADLLLVPRSHLPLRSVRFWWPYVPYALGVLLVWSVMPNVENAFQHLRQVLGSEWRLATAFYCLVENARMMLIPTGLTISHPINEQVRLSDPVTLVSLVGVIAMVAGAWFARRRLPWVSFGILWYFLLIVPSTFVHLNVVLMESRGYTASAGIALALAGLVAALWQRGPAWRRPLAAVIVVVALAFVSVGLQRQQVYASRLNLWEDAAAHNPGSYHARLNLGIQYVLAGNLDGAEQLFRGVVADFPEFVRGHHNLAHVLIERGKFEDAVALLLPLVKERPEAPNHWRQLARAYMGMGRAGDALEAMRNLINAEARNLITKKELFEVAPGESVSGFVDLALRMGRLEDALWAVGMLHRTYPGLLQGDLLEMRVLATGGRLDEAGQVLERIARKLPPGSPEVARWRADLERVRQQAPPR